MKHTAHTLRHPGTLRPVVACIALLVLGSQAALAQTAAPAPLGPFAITAGYSMQSDSNLFRSSTNAQSEQIGVATLGLGFETTQGLQRFTANVGVVNSKYKNFDYLSFTGTNYNAGWNWAVSPEWTGNLTTSRTEAATSFADATNTTQRNVRVTTATGLNTTYVLQGAWAALAGVTANKQASDQAINGADDFSSTTGDLGLQYNFSSGSNIAYRANFTNGTYLNRTVPNALLADDSYKEVANDVRATWAFSGASSVTAFVTVFNRTHPNYAVRDYSGTNTGASLNWALSGKTALAVGATHTLSAFETANTNYSTTDTISFTPTWQASPKIAVRLSAQWSEISYQGSPTAVATLDRKDNQQDTSLSVVWTPTQQVSVTGAVQKLSRTSNTAGQDYNADVLSLAATYRF